MSELENNQSAAVSEEPAVPEIKIDQAVLEAMAKAGILYGRRKSKTHPHMRSWIYTTRNCIEILDWPGYDRRHQAVSAGINRIVCREIYFSVRREALAGRNSYEFQNHF